MLVFKREQPGQDLSGMAGIDASVYRAAGLIHRGRMNPKKVSELIAHLRDEHGFVSDYDQQTADPRVRKLSPDQQGRFPHSTHLVPQGTADFLREHSRRHLAMGHEPEEALR